MYGDRSLKNIGRVTNPYRFSYPGYSEMLCGHVDRGVNSNKPTPNRKVTVLEWLNGRRGFEGHVAAYGAWDCIAAIVNTERCGFHVAAGWDPIPEHGGVPLTEWAKTINDLLARSTRLLAEEPPDSLIAEAAVEHLKKHKPRMPYVSLGEPDEWAHARRYDLYLDSIRRCDAIIRRLWETARSMPEYAGRTSLLITTDHGRGSGPRDWTDHGEKVEGADGWWAAVIGPGIPATGPRGEEPVQQCQIAATVAALAGEDYPAAEPRAGGQGAAD